MNSKRDELVKQLKKAAERFKEIMREKKDPVVRDSAIKRFEFTFELAWKTMKAILEEKGVKELYSPKDVIKAAFQNGIIGRDMVWLDMLDTRNKTTHMYNEAMADEIYSNFPKYLPLVKDFIKEIS
ncbi:nucleotidyltransferase substrate binding protein [Candidatus Saganbacteria bacterium]|nr:nucleotidyltransferase substrate binding protein [Candidatus Saganbacteria bacterium]